MKHSKLRSKLLNVPKHELHGWFKAHLKDRERSDEKYRTLANYKTWYKKFVKFLYSLQEQSIGLSNSGIGVRYKRWLEDSGAQNGYIRQQFSILIATLNRLEIYHEIRTRDLFRDYAKPSKENEDFFIDDNEVRNLIMNYDVMEDLDRAVLARFIISCFTGCRRSEVTSVRVDGNTLRYVSSKTQKGMIVPYPEVLKPIIEDGYYLYDIGAKNDMMLNEHLQNILARFQSFHESVTVYEVRGKRKVSKEVPRHKAITFHSARKFFGKMLLDRDVPLYKVSQLLGHTSIKTTEKYYAHLTKGKLIDETTDVINSF